MGEMNRAEQINIFWSPKEYRVKLQAAALKTIGSWAGENFVLFLLSGSKVSLCYLWELMFVLGWGLCVHASTVSPWMFAKKRSSFSIHIGRAP